MQCYSDLSCMCRTLIGQSGTSGCLSLSSVLTVFGMLIRIRSVLAQAVYKQHDGVAFLDSSLHHLFSSFWFPWATLFSPPASDSPYLQSDYIWGQPVGSQRGKKQCFFPILLELKLPERRERFLSSKFQFLWFPLAALLPPWNCLGTESQRMEERKNKNQNRISVLSLNNSSQN